MHTFRCSLVVYNFKRWAISACKADKLVSDDHHREGIHQSVLVAQHTMKRTASQGNRIGLELTRR
jgi:hypothetical protein